MVTVKVAAFSGSTSKWNDKFTYTEKTGLARGYCFEFEFVDAIDPEGKFDLAVAVFSCFDDAISFGDRLCGLKIPLLVVGVTETGRTMDHPGGNKKPIKQPLSKRNVWMLSERLGASLVFVQNTNFPNNIVTQLIDCYEQGFCVNCDTEQVDYPDNDVFSEFCRVFGPIIREKFVGQPEANVMRALTNMWKAAPPQLKMKLKRDITPVSASGELHIPYLPATEL